MSFEQRRCGKKPGVSKKTRHQKASTAKYVTQCSSSANFQICAFVACYLLALLPHEGTAPRHRKFKPCPIIDVENSVSSFYTRIIRIQSNIS